VAVEDVRVGSEGELVVAVRPVWRERDRCGGRIQSVVATLEREELR
jgi:hypothetical protein